jgi:hypothetical protein
MELCHFIEEGKLIEERQSDHRRLPLTLIGGKVMAAGKCSTLPLISAAALFWEGHFHWKAGT